MPRPRRVPRDAAAATTRACRHPSRSPFEATFSLATVVEGARGSPRTDSPHRPEAPAQSRRRLPAPRPPVREMGVGPFQVARSAERLPHESAHGQKQPKRHSPAARPPCPLPRSFSPPARRLRLGHATRTPMLAHSNRLALSRRGIMAPPRGGSAVAPTANDDRSQRFFAPPRARTTSGPTRRVRKLTSSGAPHASEPRLWLGTRPTAIAFHRRGLPTTANAATSSRTRLASRDVASRPLTGLDHPVSNDAIVLEPPLEPRLRRLSNAGTLGTASARSKTPRVFRQRARAARRRPPQCPGCVSPSLSRGSSTTPRRPRKADPRSAQLPLCCRRASKASGGTRERFGSAELRVGV
jgi:hypothetical protein